MAQIVRSGAFLQQCWSVHPLCVGVKRMGADRTVVLSCSSCKSAHYLTVGAVVPKGSAAQGAEPGDQGVGEAAGDLLLNACISTHRASITLREMDVFQDLVLLRCADCRRHYTLQVSAFETHQT
jgi:ribosomal protein L33